MEIYIPIYQIYKEEKNYDLYYDDLNFFNIIRKWSKMLFPSLYVDAVKEDNTAKTVSIYLISSHIVL